MGFPMGYSYLLLPKIVLHLFLLLGTLRRFLVWGFRAIGLGDLVEFDDDPPIVPGRSVQYRCTELESVPSVMIDEALPVVKFEELVSRCCGEVDSVCCAVCLYDVTGGDEVRQLSNCTHVFHKGCIDRWIEHDQHTCPLCRAKLIPDEMGGCYLDSDDSGIGTGTDDMEFSEYDYFFPSLHSSPMQNPILFQAHELLRATYLRD